MDSLTHIVLGAACGQAIAGKQLGNRAMLWGAIGCTVPDFDVFAAFFTDEITSISFHRGLLHSILFAAVAPWLLAWFTEWFYGNDIYRKKGIRVAVAVFLFLVFAFFTTVINFIADMIAGEINGYLLAVSVLLGAWLIVGLRNRYLRGDLADVRVPYRTWFWIFFVSVLAHPMLDSFTNWGTQLWQPFADTRIQWCTMAVADPFCTVPFSIALILAARLPKSSGFRPVFTWIGLAWFCGYICLYSVWHKTKVDRAFENSLHERAIPYSRYYTNPSIFNNIVWFGVAESDTAFYYSMYGFNDRNPEFRKWSVIPKNHALLPDFPESARARNFIRWFSDGYYSVKPWNGDTLVVSDLRFGLMGDTLKNNNYSFQFLFFKNKSGIWDIRDRNRDRRNEKEARASFGELWNKIKGE